MSNIYGFDVTCDEQEADKVININYLGEKYELARIRKTNYSTCLYSVKLSDYIRKRLNIGSEYVVVSDNIIPFIIVSILKNFNVEEFLWEVNTQ